MTVGILLVTHSDIGPALLQAATRMLGRLPMRSAAFEVPFDADLDRLLPAASSALRSVDEGGGVLILTDLYGASPSNLAARLAQLGTPVQRVAGLNLSMLLRCCNYAEQPLEDLARTAANGGRNGVISGNG